MPQVLGYSPIVGIDNTRSVVRHQNLDTGTVTRLESPDWSLESPDWSHQIGASPDWSDKMRIILQSGTQNSQ